MPCCGPFQVQTQQSSRAVVSSIADDGREPSCSNGRHHTLLAVLKPGDFQDSRDKSKRPALFFVIGTRDNNAKKGQNKKRTPPPSASLPVSLSPSPSTPYFLLRLSSRSAATAALRASRPVLSLPPFCFTFSCSTRTRWIDCLSIDCLGCYLGVPSVLRHVVSSDSHTLRPP